MECHTINSTHFIVAKKDEKEDPIKILSKVHSARIISDEIMVPIFPMRGKCFPPKKQELTFDLRSLVLEKVEAGLSAHFIARSQIPQTLLLL